MLSLRNAPVLKTPRELAESLPTTSALSSTSSSERNLLSVSETWITIFTVFLPSAGIVGLSVTIWILETVLLAVVAVEVVPVLVVAVQVAVAPEDVDVALPVFVVSSVSRSKANADGTIADTANVASNAFEIVLFIVILLIIY